MLESLEETLARQLLDQPDADYPALRKVQGGPLDVDDVWEDGRQLAQLGDVDGLGRAFRLHVRLVGGNGIGQLAHLPVHVDADAGGKLVALLRRRIQLAEAQLDLIEKVELGVLAYVPVGGDVGGLLRRKVELVRRLLRPYSQESF